MQAVTPAARACAASRPWGAAVMTITRIIRANSSSVSRGRADSHALAAKELDHRATSVAVALSQLLAFHTSLVVTHQNLLLLGTQPHAESARNLIISCRPV